MTVNYEDPGGGGSPRVERAIERAARTSSTIRELAGAPVGTQAERGYFHTLREICQQPDTWRATAGLVAAERLRLGACLEAAGVWSRRAGLVLTGSGSSGYVGECAALALQARLRVPVFACPGGLLLAHGPRAVPPDLPLLVVSIARSGNSPESCGVVDLFLERRPECRHLVITCNRDGALARRYAEHPWVIVLALDEATNDRSLVMTSSFTNLVVAALGLGWLDCADDFRDWVADLAHAGETVVASADRLAEAARGSFASVMFLGTGALQGAAREAALKMLEMTGGQVRTIAEGFLGVRHGPMSAVHADTLVVGLMSADPVARAYERDVIEELRPLSAAGGTSGAPGRRLLVVDDVSAPADSPPLPLGDERAALLGVVTGQLLAFFRCLHEGLEPDNPSPHGVITRVVRPFTLHR